MVSASNEPGRGGHEGEKERIGDDLQGVVVVGLRGGGVGVWCPLLMVGYNRLLPGARWWIKSEAFGKPKSITISTDT